MKELPEHLKKEIAERAENEVNVRWDIDYPYENMWVKGYIAGATEYANEVERLKENNKSWADMAGPILKYVQEEGGAKRWGIRPGDDIFEIVLEILKTAKL